jgi:large subunit ribosomal protein L6
MSRIGKLPIEIPQNVNVTLNDKKIEVKGPNGLLSREIPTVINIELKNNKIILTKTEETRIARQLYGLQRSLINNMIIGVSKKFEKKLQMIGVGYRAQVQGKELTLNIGYSHPVLFTIPKEIEITVETNTKLTISGPNKEEVGLLASKIRATRPPEPYKGKGIRYINEIVLRKAGKSGK